MSRKEKKQKRKAKRTPKKKFVLTKAENDACWRWARLMTKMRKFPKEWQQKKVYCSTCKQFYCLGADEVDQFCSDCYIMANKKAIEDSGGIFTGCMKEVTGGRTCQHCQRL